MRYSTIHLSIGTTVLILALFGTSQGADRVELLSGEMLYGRVLKANDDEVAIQLGTGGVLTFKRSNVRFVRRSSDESAEEQDSSESTEARGGGKLGPRKALPKESPRINRLEKEPPLEDGKPADSASHSPAPDVPATLLTLEKERIAIMLPGNFKPWAEGKTEGVVAAYSDPSTRAAFTITAGKSQDSVEESKKQAVQAYCKAFTSFTVHRNERLKKSDKDTEPQTWIVESEGRAGEQSLRMIQVFAKRDQDLFVLTYTATRESYEKLRGPFDRSVSTLRFLEATSDAR